METHQQDSREATGETETEEREQPQRLTRYADYDPFTFYHTDSVEGFPRGPIEIRVGGRICGSLTPDWEGIRGVLAEMFRRPMSGNLTEEEKTRLSTLAAEEAASHVLEFMPEKIERAVQQLCLEALIVLLKGRSVVRSLPLPGLADTVQQLVRDEGEAIKARLCVHPGPTAFFLNGNHYENVLRQAAANVMSRGEKITQATVAEELARSRRDATIDERMIRRWNSEYGLNWKVFVGSFTNRTSSD